MTTKTPPIPHIFRIQRYCVAACTVVGVVAIIVSALTNPPYFGTEPGIRSAIATNASDSDLMDLTHLVALLIAAYLLPVGFVAMAWLANPRAPYLASVGLGVTLLGFLPLALYVGQDSVFYDIARWGSDPRHVDLAERWNADGVMSFYGIVFGVGSVFGPALLGLALWRSRAVPLWAALCVTLSRLPVLMFALVPYRVETAIVIAGTLLLLIGSLAVAAAVARSPEPKEG